MKLRLKFLPACLAALASTLHAAAPISEWKHVQQFEISSPGLLKFSLPPATLDAARPALEDLRLFDAAGHEIPFALERPFPSLKAVQPAKSFQSSISAGRTLITVETGMVQPIESATLDSPAPNFVKSVQVEGSPDGRLWQVLAQGRPIFRQFTGASQMLVSFPSGSWPWLRLSVDDQRSPPIPFTGARVHAAAREPTPGEPAAVTVTQRDETPGESRLTLDLGAANLDLASIEIESPEPLFVRHAALAVPIISDDATIREQTLAQGSLYRASVDGQAAYTNLVLAVEKQVRSRQAILVIHNQDSPPLLIPSVRALRRPVYLVFQAPQAGAFRVLTGNSRCPAASYDLTRLGAALKNVPVSPIQLSPLSANPDYHAPDVIPEVQLSGTALDVSAWKFRKSIRVAQPGVQQLELDLEILSHSQAQFEDLRLIREGRQVPYVLERTSINRAIQPVVTDAPDPREPKLSRWKIKLPFSDLPLSKLVCRSGSPLFQRDVSLYEERSDERGQPFRRSLASAHWIQTPDGKSREFTLALDNVRPGDTLFLETRNGDNPAIALEAFQVFYPVTRALFKASPGDVLFLYFGNPKVAAPSYDLSLVAGQFLTAEKSPAALAPAEQLQKASWSEIHPPGTGGFVLWGILALVVVVLLFVVARLLPKAPPPS